MRDFINEAAHRDVSAIILTTMCDQVRHGHALLERAGTRESFLFNLPATWKTPAATELYIAELERLGQFLVSVGGVRPGEGVLASTMLAYDQARATAARPPPVGKTPIAILGGALSAADNRLLELLADLGGRIVLDGTESGERTMPACFDRQRLDDAPLQELARAYFGTIPDAFRRPDSQLFLWLKAKINERKPRGIVFLRQVWCDLWHAESRRIRDWCDLPMLDLDLNGDDPIPRNKTRLEAFMEIVR